MPPSHKQRTVAKNPVALHQSNKWIKMEYTCVVDNDYIVQGKVWHGVIGVHKNDANRYVVTHLATGLQFLGVNKYTLARTVAETLVATLPIEVWTESNPKTLSTLGYWPQLARWIKRIRIDQAIREPLILSTRFNPFE